MGATPHQVQAVLYLGLAASDSEGLDISETEVFNSNYGEVYHFDANDPHQLASAKKKLLEPVSIRTTGTASDISTPGGTSDCGAAISNWGGDVNITTGITYILNAGTTGATSSPDGTITAWDNINGNGTIAQIAVVDSDPTFFVEELIVISGQG